jgi:hypothetical protein
MGEYTNHSLVILEKGDSELSLDEHKEMISRKAGYDDWLFDGESAKWYGHEKDMRAYSVKFPNTIFILEGEGEESGDIWKEYHKDGKMQRCKAKVSFDSFDESLLG